MKSQEQFAWRTRWCTMLFIFALVASIVFGGAAIRADDPATATPNASAGSLGAPPPTVAPTATAAPTTTPAATATTAPTSSPTPTSTTVAPSAASGAAPSPATTATTTSTATSTVNANAPVDNGSVASNEAGGDGGPHNVVKVINKNDGKFRMKGKIQINHIPGDNASPVNDSEAYASCANCETFAVALQIDLISRSATTIAPQNVAIAVNVQCSHCTTVSRAVQYVYQVDDPSQIPDNVRDLVNQMQDQLNAAAKDKDATVAQTEARVDAVIAQFNELAQSLNNQRNQSTDDDTPGGSVPSDATP